MKRRLLLYFLPFLIAFFAACSGVRTNLTSQEKKTAAKDTLTEEKDFAYSFYFLGSATLSMPADEITIDTSGQMYFVSQQRLPAGNWTKPRGLAFLEQNDLDTLLSIIKDSTFFYISNDDVSAQCAEGSEISFQLYRMDIHKGLKIKTNTCAADYNLLTGNERKLFKKFMYFMQNIRERYRPKILPKK